MKATGRFQVKNVFTICLVIFGLIMFNFQNQTVTTDSSVSIISQEDSNYDPDIEKITISKNFAPIIIVGDSNFTETAMTKS